MRSLNVAIIGAGPAGLATALYLNRDGHKAIIFERFERALPVGSGLMLQPTGLSVLADLGVYGHIRQLGHRIDRLSGIDAKSGRTVLDVTYSVLRNGRFGLAVNRHALFSVLHDEALRQGIEIQTGCNVADIRPAAYGHHLVTNSGSAIGPFDLVVDTSGARSKLRRHSKFPCEPKPLPYGALWATLDWVPDKFEPHALTQRYDKASVMIGVLPTGKAEKSGGDKMAFFWSLKPDMHDAVKAQGLDAWKQKVFAYWPECQNILNQISSFDDMTLAVYGHHTLKIAAGPGIAFVGDSAHSTSPQLGQGANMALLDAKALAHAVATQPDVPAALEAYASSRRRHLAVFQAMSSMFTPFYQSDSSLLAFVRDRFVSTLARIPPAPQILTALVCGTLVDPFQAIGLTEQKWESDPLV